MHIPDGYLSLETTIPALGVMLPVWTVALNKIKNTLKQKQIPLLSICAAFAFVIMMFNIPIGASSVHAVGSVFIAILLGPWAACIAVTVALIIQAFVFGDGGILAIGVNCFNMAFAMPFTGYFFYKLVVGKSEITSKRSILGIFAGSYIGLNIAALLTAIELGIQPLLFKAADGTPLFGFFPLSVSIPAIMFENILVAGPIEAIITVSAIIYIAKFAPHLINHDHKLPAEPEVSFLKRYKAIIIALVTLIAVTPLGLIATGTAWGEWGSEQIKDKIGYIPAGFTRLSEIWDSLMPDYSISGLNSTVGYISCAVVGTILISILMYFTSKLMKKMKKDQS